MKTIFLAASLAAVTLAGVAGAQAVPSPARGPMRADTDRDGVVTRAEASAEADARFARMDADHDGRVTPEERRAAMRAMRAERQGGRRPDHGSGAERPRDGGGVTAAEFRERALARFDRADADRDGRIDRAELAARMERMRGHGGDASPPPPPAQ